MTANTTENTTGAGATAAQILDRATLPLAYHWKATADKAAMIADFLGVKSINDPLFAAMEDAIEARFHELIVADNCPKEYRTIDIDREEYRRLNNLTGRGRSIPRGSYGGGDSYSVTIRVASGAVIDLFHWFDPSF